MATINSDGSISGGGTGSTTQSGSGATSNTNNIKDTTDGSENQFDTGYSGNAVISADGSLIATPGEDITQVGNEVNAGPGQITGAATLKEAKEAVAEAGGNPSKVEKLVTDPSADSEGSVLDLKSEISSTVEETMVENSIANTIGSITRNRPSPLSDSDESDSDMSNVTTTVVGDGDGGSDYSITGTVDKDTSEMKNTGPQSVPGVPYQTGFSFRSLIIPFIGIIALIFGLTEYNE